MPTCNFWRLVLILGGLVATSKSEDTLHTKLHELIPADDVAIFREFVAENFNGSVSCANSTNWTPLMVASFHGSQSIVQDILADNTVQLNAQNLVGETALHLASLNAHFEVVRALIEAAQLRELLGVVVEAQTLATKRTPLFYAASSPVKAAGIAEAATLLVQNGHANMEHRDASGMQPIHVALRNERLDVLQLLLETNGNVSEATCCGYRTISHLAAEQNLADFLTEWPKHFNPAALDGKGQNAACWAAINGSVDFGRKMANELSLPMNMGRCALGKSGALIGSPLHAAAYHRQKPYVELLLSQDGVVEQLVEETTCGSPLHVMALKPGPVDSISETIVDLIRNKSESVLDSIDQDGRTPFLVAIKSSAVDFAKLLEKAGANVTIRDGRGYSALHLANAVETLDYLLKLKPFSGQFDLRTEIGQLTPLHVAILEKKPISFLSFLLFLPIDKAAANDLGQSAAHLAVKQNYVKAVELFLSEESFPFTVRDINGRTPLLLAIELGRIEPARIMIVNEHHFNAEDLREAIHLAVAKNLPEIVQQLLARDPNMATLVNANNETPFHQALSDESIEIADLLVKTKTEVVESLRSAIQTKDARGRTVVHLLATRCSPFTLEIGTRLGAFYGDSIDEADLMGETPLEIAVERNCIEFVRLLLASSANCTRLNRQGYTALHIAKRLGFDKLVNSMVATGNCSLDQVDSCGIAVQEMKLTVADRCDALPLIENGEIVADTLQAACIGTQFRFNCATGYVLSGSSVIECNSAGRWLIKGHCESSLQVSSLEEKTSTCKGIPIIENGEVALNSSSAIGSTALFTCNSGYALRGSNVIECGTTGRWQVKGFCDGFCNKPASCFGEVPSNGSLYKIGSRRLIACRPGFVQVGFDFATCGPDGEWQLKARCLDHTAILELQKQLVQASAESNLEKVRHLVDLGVLDLNWRDGKEYGKCDEGTYPVKNGTALHRAISCIKEPATLDVVKLLIDNGADVNAREGSNGRTPLIYAANNGHLEAVRLLLDRGAEINFKDNHGNSPLTLAAWKGYIENVKLLLDRGADIGIRDSGGDTPLFDASKNAQLETIRLLLDRGADIHARDNNGDTALFEAVKYGHIDTIKLLLDRGADLNAVENNGNTPLALAAWKGLTETARLLIDRGADVNTRNKNNNTPITLSSWNGHIETVRLLIDRGGDVNTSNKDGNTALTLAAWNGHLDTVRLLLDQGADITVRDNSGDTALFDAAKNGRLETVRLLLDRGAEVNAKDKNNETPLIEAAKNGQLETVELLIDSGADVKAKNVDGETALVLASRYYKHDVARLLVSRGA